MSTRKPIGLSIPYRKVTKEEAVKAMLNMRGGNKVKKLSEATARSTIARMRSIASHVPVSPFHMQAADDMESLLDEVLKFRHEKEK